MTIKGGPFGKEATDNPVKIGDNYCIVERMTESEIWCRIVLSNPVQPEAEAEVVVFAKASEEAVCGVRNRSGCTFKYVRPQAIAHTLT